MVCLFCKHIVIVPTAPAKELARLVKAREPFVTKVACATCSTVYKLTFSVEQPSPLSEAQLKQRMNVHS